MKFLSARTVEHGPIHQLVPLICVYSLLVFLFLFCFVFLRCHIFFRHRSTEKELKDGKDSAHLELLIGSLYCRFPFGGRQKEGTGRTKRIEQIVIVILLYLHPIRYPFTNRCSGIARETESTYNKRPNEFINRRSIRPDCSRCPPTHFTVQ